MNIVGLYVPKIIMIIAIWIPQYDTNAKVIMTIIWLFKSIVDYDHAKPGHSGKIYILLKRLDYEKKGIVADFIMVLVGVGYLVTAIFFKSYISAALEGFHIILWLCEMITDIKDIK